MCDHPLYAISHLNEVTNKKVLRFIDLDEYQRLESVGVRADHELLKIPCGQCTGCRLEYSRQWAMRCVLESLRWKNNYFVTLTYDDEHLPSCRPIVDKETGEFFGFFPLAPLCPDDLTKFMRDFRRYCEYHYNWQNMRFFACGEYGSKNGRCHFHIILFNAPDLEMIPDARNHRGEVLYVCPDIDKVWKKGLVRVGTVTFESCAYVARYVMKKHKGKDFHFYDDNGLVPEFTRMSRRPGIAKAYFDENADHTYRFDEIVLPGGKRCRPPKYFDKLYDVEHHEELAAIKEKRKEKAERSLEKKLKRTSLDENSYLALCAANRELALQKLVRQV